MGRLRAPGAWKADLERATAQVLGAQRRPLHLPDASRQLPWFLRTLKPQLWQATVGDAEEP